MKIKHSLISITQTCRFNLKDGIPIIYRDIKDEVVDETEEIANATHDEYNQYMVDKFILEFDGKNKSAAIWFNSSEFINVLYTLLRFHQPQDIDFDLFQKVSEIETKRNQLIKTIGFTLEDIAFRKSKYSVMFSLDKKSSKLSINVFSKKSFIFNHDVIVFLNAFLGLVSICLSIEELSLDVDVLVIIDKFRLSNDELSFLNKLNVEHYDKSFIVNEIVNKPGYIPQLSSDEPIGFDPFVTLNHGSFNVTIFK